jgi:hypothetical protein
MYFKIRCVLKKKATLVGFEQASSGLLKSGLTNYIKNLLKLGCHVPDCIPAHAKEVF